MFQKYKRNSHALIGFRDYLFIDSYRINSYVEQLGGLAPQRKKSSRKTSISIKGPATEATYEDIAAEASYPEKISFLHREMKDKGYLVEGRLSEFPKSNQNVTSLFFYERTIATPILLHKQHLIPELGLSAMKIWISDPDPRQLNGPQWSYRGSFLFLTELTFDDDKYHTLVSGCSALRMIANAATGLPLLKRSGVENFGRDSSDHPAEKLLQLGGFKGDRKRIEVLYRIRYMSDEQKYIYDGSQHRVHDILGYPLYISTW